LLADQKLSLELSDAAMDLLCEVGYDPQFGARPLKRAIQRLLQDLLAQKILTGQFKPGDTISVERNGDKLIVGQVTFSQGKKSAKLS